ncbi:hypothetical protein PV05_09983 [Exophiala xenobiotica]|uniref:Uncharacterized protein n=1 Tax=Exophiala xenobiotica TaxID=348802 RepID=A0A0D2BG85_9EURO|nr:uncharacterized protein PV05_09983 [Exophiala xenobiotica]KIW51241.1 hypothetical protein PV05_09983 [Exophiala xenobiotica]
MQSPRGSLLCLVTFTMFNIHALVAASLSTNPTGFQGVTPESTIGCTYTAYTEPVISTGPTTTRYTLTTYTSKLYDCDGCSNIEVLVLGHVFLKANYTSTVTASNATTFTRAQCSPTPAPVA